MKNVLLACLVLAAAAMSSHAEDFSNPAAISIVSMGVADPYPSSISVSGAGATVTHVTVTLTGLSHTAPFDVDVLLVGPTGASVILMSECGWHFEVSDATLTFSDAAAMTLPFDDTIVSGTYRPTDYDPPPTSDSFPAPAPAGPYGSVLAGFVGTNPNGEWQLFVVNAEVDAGEIAGGWTLHLTTGGACCDPDGSCAMTAEADCTGVWHPEWASCGEADCPQPTGACCDADGSCAVTTEADCDGVWHSEWASCGEADCPLPTRACCAPDGSCAVTTEADCDGAWHAEWASCGEADCPQPVVRAACCDADGSCSVTTEDDCGGTWHSAWASCGEADCPQPVERAACCGADGSCEVTTEAACDGTWHAEWTSCAAAECPQPQTWYRDADGDGFGDADATQQALEQPAGYVAEPGDCDDSDEVVNPSATEVCNERDDDCDGAVDEGGVCEDQSGQGQTGLCPGTAAAMLTLAFAGLVGTRRRVRR